MSKSEPILRVKDLSTHFFTYAGNVKALDAINLKIDRKKESLGLVGETGCGKSVTALSIMQLIPQPPGKIIQGEIWFNGENLLTKSASYMQKEIRGKNISMIFQEPMTSLNPVIRIADQIMEAILLHPETNENGDGEVRDRAIELLDLTGIPDPEEVATRYPHQLSGGMRQRVMISMALACNPKLLIADEPTTALDVTIQAQILGLINKIRDKFGISLLLITHHLGLISAMCDKVAVMYAGTIVEYSDLKSIFNNPIHPYTQGLLRCIPRLGGKRGRKLSTIPGNVPDLINPPSGCRFHPRCDKSKPECGTTKPTLIKMEKNHFVACHP
ncbi:MAG: ABC transporter ATP-binding protein [Candidatus Hodarchaeales archaeon]|jgi:peptide/nickel transport system ATP-binding protein/oligopeptide transport system ATP-binding protein